MMGRGRLFGWYGGQDMGLPVRGWVGGCCSCRCCYQALSQPALPGLRMQENEGSQGACGWHEYFVGI